MILRVATLSVAMFAFLAANAWATLIDSFGGEEQSCTVSSGWTHDSLQKKPGSGIAIGGIRDIAMDWLRGGRSFIDVLTESDGSGIFFTQGTGQAKTTVTWDGTNSPDSRAYSLGADLTDGKCNQFLLDVAEVTGSGVDVKMTVYTDDTHASEHAFFLSEIEAPGIVVYVSYGLFTTVPGAVGPADFASVGAIVLEVNGGGHSGSDIKISSIETVPEPSTSAMAAVAGLVFLGVGRRRRIA